MINLNLGYINIEKEIAIALLIGGKTGGIMDGM